MLALVNTFTKFVRGACAPVHVFPTSPRPIKNRPQSRSHMGQSTAGCHCSPLGLGVIDLFRYIVFPPRNFGLEMTFATRQAHRAPRHALGPSAICTGYILSYTQAVRKTPPPPPRDERAIARSLDVWRDLRGGTHEVGPRLDRGPSVFRSFCRDVV